MPSETNTPSLWKNQTKQKPADGHKYKYGHAVVYGRTKMTGAACLAAKSALRMGAGLVTVATRQDVANVYRSYCPSLIVEEMRGLADFKEHFRDERKNAILIGPGAGFDDRAGLKAAVVESVVSGKICVLDADALTVFEDGVGSLLGFTHHNCIFTPHDGEFEKVFPGLTGTKIERAIQAAKKSKAIIVLKGHETVIAAPDGKYTVNNNGSPWLATAGTGDVLAGMIAGFAAWHKTNLFEAVCASVWMHGRASQIAGAGMISADLPDIIPQVWKLF